MPAIPVGSIEVLSRARVTDGALEAMTATDDWRWLPGTLFDVQHPLGEQQQLFLLARVLAGSAEKKLKFGLKI